VTDADERDQRYTSVLPQMLEAETPALGSVDRDSIPSERLEFKDIHIVPQSGTGPEG